MTLFPGFAAHDVRVGDNIVHAVVGPRRNGPALLLLHGYPQTHAIWHKAAPELARRFNVVAADLRGYRIVSEPPALRHFTARFAPVG